MLFSDIRGNDAVVAALRGMVDTGRLPHAMLLHENEGGGAFPLVLSFLQYLYCRDRRNGEACRECPSCNKVSKLIHPDIHFVFPVAGKDKPVSDQFLGPFRELALSRPYFREDELYAAFGMEGKQALISVQEAKTLLDKLSLSAVEGGYRCVVVYLPEKMNQQAANTLLKMVEEPPEKTLFLMITHAPEKVLATIFSRCLFLRILPPPVEAAVPAANLMEEDGPVFMDLFSELMGALLDRDLLTALETGESLASLENRDKQKSFCKFASECLRWIFFRQQGLEHLAPVPEEWSESVSTLASRCRKTFPRGAAGYLDRAVLLLERNVSQKVLFTDLVNRLYMIV